MFLKIKPGKERNVVKSLRGIKEIKEVHVVLGIWDAIARIEAETIPGIEKVFFRQIEVTPGVNEARLHIVACPRTRK